MSDAYHRGSTIGKVTEALLWVQTRRRPFTAHDLADHMGCHTITAHRYLLSFAISDVVVARQHPANAWVWRVL